MKEFRIIKRAILNLVCLCLMSYISACDTERELIQPITQSNYNVLLSAIDGFEEITLEGFSSPLSIVVEDDSWLSYEVTVDNNGNPVLTISATDSAPNISHKQKVYVKDAKQNEITIDVSQAVLPSLTDNDNEDFLKHWESVDTLRIYSNNNYQKVMAPWVRTSVTTLPETIRFDVKSADGWEMAFSLLGIDGLNGVNYFGLYNKFTGTLRIFYYVDNAFTTGSNYCFEVNLGSMIANVKYPYYHALQYAIPTSHSNLNKSIDLMNIGGGKAMTFKTFITPYSDNIHATLTQGWTAFDLDASGYCPPEVEYLNSNEQLMISVHTAQEAMINLCGGLSADIKGNFSQIEETVVSSSSGCSKTFRQLGSYGNTASKPVGTVIKSISGVDVTGAINGFGSVCNFLSGVLSKDFDEIQTKVDSMAGKIQLALTGKIDLAGKITSEASNTCVPITLGNNVFLSSSNYGKGVWSLQEDPVVYILGDRILGNKDRVYLESNGDGSYFEGMVDPAKDNLRIVAYLDPSSIKVNLNREVFKDVQDLEIVDAYFGVFPDETSGHSSKFKNLLGISYPTLKILEGNEKKTWKSFSTSNKVKYTRLNATDILSPELGETVNTCAIYQQKNSNIRFYGKIENKDDKPYILNPQILLPYSVSDNGNLTYYDGEMPDLYVTVTIKFKAGESIYVMSQRFIPQVKVASSTDVSNHHKMFSTMDKTAKNNGIYSQNNLQFRKHVINTLTERILKILNVIDK